MRLAIVSPLPPSPTGIADYTMDVVKALTPSRAIELFHDQEAVASSDVPSFRIEDLMSRNERSTYDAVIYQMGNAPAHDFMYESMERVPGVVVLHDLVLHHSYARRFLESAESAAYAADPSSREKQILAEGDHARYLAAVDEAYPGEGARLKDAHFNTTGDLLPYAYPLFQPALKHARAVAAHNNFMVDAVRSARPDLPCTRLAMPVESVAVPSAAVAEVRRRFAIADDDIVVGSFGLLTREKRIETLARAVKRVTEIHPKVRLLLAGSVADSGWLNELLDRAGIRDRAIVPGRLPVEEFAAAMEASDLVVHLRYPTARETSAALLRVMAQGRPVVISDIANQAEIPEEAVRRVDPCDEEGDLARAIEELIRRPDLAAALGQSARRFVSAEHSQAATLETYEQLLKSVRPHYSHPSR